MRIATMGYEGMNPEAFFDLLKKAEVETIVDVRELPISHKPGFSKKALTIAAPLHGLNYLHIGALGSPSDLRHQYRDDGDWSAFSKGYRQYLKSQETAISELKTLLKNSFCCLLCFETNYLLCHRSILVNRLRTELEEELIIMHLAPMPKGDIAWLQPEGDKLSRQLTIGAESGAYFPLGTISLSG